MWLVALYPHLQMLASDSGQNMNLNDKIVWSKIRKEFALPRTEFCLDMHNLDPLLWHKTVDYVKME